MNIDRQDIFSHRDRKQFTLRGALNIHASLPQKEFTMEFFIPAVNDTAQAERVYEAVARFNNAHISDRRIFELAWKHKGISMCCKVGGEAPAYYRTHGELVVAILDCGSLYKVCTASRGVARGEAILVGKADESVPTYFEPITTPPSS